MSKHIQQHSFWDTIKLCGRPKMRRWAYRVSGAALVVAGIYGIVDGDKQAAFLVLFAAIFGVADANVSEQ